MARVAGKRDKSDRAGMSGLGALAVALALAASSPASAESLSDALARAYRTNPEVNGQRAAVRAQDEGVPKAESGFLPTVSLQGDTGLQTFSQFDGYSTTGVFSRPRGFGVSVSQKLYNGGQTINAVHQAQATVFSGREQLRYTEQNVLVSAVTAYMDVMRDTAILALRQDDVRVIESQLDQTRKRAQIGEITPTDVSQAEQSLAQAQAEAVTARVNLHKSMATYRQVVGEAPKSLSPVPPLAGLPKTLAAALAIGLGHPAILENVYDVDAADYAVKVSQGQLYPSLSVVEQFQRRADVLGYAAGSNNTTASVTAQLTVPIYDGGQTFASIRQAKEQRSQQQLQTDLVRDKVRAAVESAWEAHVSSAELLRAAQAQVASAEAALRGVREEAKVGQRTTLDVLNAQATLAAARIQVVNAQHDRVVNSYELASALGRASPHDLGLRIAEYDPSAHYERVRLRIIGQGTPEEHDEVEPLIEARQVGPVPSHRGK